LTKSIQVGTSGWHYGHWKVRFYPPDLREPERLGFYAKHFDIVELNNTFYRLPTEAAVLRWRDTSPPNFRFAVKGSRFLTHMKKLKDPALGLERFFARIDLLGSKLGPILFQLPPHWTIDEDRLRGFLEALPPGNRYAFEFRNASWNTESVYKLLARFRAAYCIFDLAGFQSPFKLTADFTYIRLHGPGGRYEGSYEDAKLRSWANYLREWDLANAYVFFDNDQAAYAVENATRLITLLGAAATLPMAGS
jgi:uncharacterized protein YecE (DUF72 family)